MAKLTAFLEQMALGVAVTCVVIMMLIVSYDAFSRYAFNAPLPWAFDVVSYYLLSASVYLAVSATFRSGDHINIDLFRMWIRPQLRARLDAVWGIMAAGAFAIITYGCAQQAIKAFKQGSFLTGYILWPAWIPYAVIAVGCTILTLRLVVHSITLAVRGEDNEVALQGEPNE